MEVGVHFLLNYSAHEQRGAAWKLMSFCLGIIDMQAGKYLLAHPLLPLPVVLRSVSDTWAFFSSDSHRGPWTGASGKVMAPYVSFWGMAIFLSIDVVPEALSSGILEVMETGLLQNIRFLQGHCPGMVPCFYICLPEPWRHHFL